ncbi:hypothetical protein OpiT1DRAFT_00187 [Opitutaceae bacterium TAV1]|nr:hypothetical protein OpiT1DRAFT_00187 [Opitutaceae bacterium TAV1]
MSKKHKRNRIEITDTQKARLDAAVEALHEILVAYEAANGESDSVEIALKIERGTNIADKWPRPRITKPWWTVGGYFDGQGSGATLPDAFERHFAANDATKKREAANLCRIQADIYEREADAIDAEDKSRE